jgi:cytochrome c oxidase subunit 2
MQKMGWLLGTAAVLGLFAAFPALAEEARSIYNMPQGVTAISREVYDLHMLILGVVCAIGVVVFGAMIWSIIFHRRSRHPKPADFHESTTVEIIWTTLPFIILIGMAIPAAGTLIRMEDTRGSDMTIKVTGYQWKWEYEYVDQGVKFFSTMTEESNKARQLGSGIDVTQVPNYLLDVDHPLVVPVGKKIRFLITANDVIHSWWVHDLAIKKDAIPGYINEVWTNIDTPGTYRGVCAELCGRDHGFMPIVVIALPEAEYQAWLTKQKNPAAVELAAATPAPVTDAAPAAAPVAVAAAAAAAAAPAAAPAAAVSAKMSKDELMAQGKKVFEANCAACHQATGQGLPPNFPSLIGSLVVKGPIAEHIKQALNGKNLMAPFKHLSDADIAAVVSYERNSWGNSGDFAQPEQVKALR